jgi:hypothetical protein
MLGLLTKYKLDYWMFLISPLSFPISVGILAAHIGDRLSDIDKNTERKE